MKPSQRLIDALRRAADRIEAEPGCYEWSLAHKCNCGLLARELLNVDALRIHVMATHETRRSVWSENACPSTGEPVHEIIQKLFDAGVSSDDITELENLSSQAVRERAGIGSWGGYISPVTAKRCYGDYDDREKVIAYFRAQADLLAEQLAAQQPAPAKPAEPMGCCHMWLECGVCMLCSATKPAEQKELV